MRACLAASSSSGTWLAVPRAYLEGLLQLQDNHGLHFSTLARSNYVHILHKIQDHSCAMSFRISGGAILGVIERQATHTKSD
jgi:hypothetical protein